MDGLQDWPEPVIRVQSISDCEAQTIPDRYIKPPTERPVDLNAGQDNTKEVDIPIIDLGLSIDNTNIGSDTPTTLGDSSVKAISDACREWGFFQVVNHGIRTDLMKKAMELWRGFFHLPMEAKQAYANSPKTYEGYGSRLGVEKGAILDWGDYYFLHFLPLNLKDYNKWPELPPCLRETMDEYNVEMNKLCRRVLSALSLGLGLEEDRLQTCFGGMDVGMCLRVNYYPKCPQPELTLGLSRHSDPGGITVLLADYCVKGLQVRRHDNWITVQPVPDAFIINVGDQIQVMSNATYKSVEHRVIVSEAERLSLALFYNPKSDIPIQPLPELVSIANPAMYQPMTYDEYRLFMRKMGPKGKAQVESLKKL